MVSDEEQADHVSQYNGGRGIQIILELQPLPRPASGAKQRKNAKSRTSAATIFIYEHATIEFFLNEAAHALKCKFDFGEFDDLADLDHEITYTIPRTQLKGIRIGSDDDYQVMIEEVQKWPTPTVKVMFRELPKEDNEDHHITDEESENPRKKSKKSHEPSPEEIEQSDAIKALQNKYRCEDRACPFDLCWVSSTSEHIHLTFRHLQLWAAGIVEMPDEITLDQPPNNKMFDPTFRNAMDAALLSRRSRATDAKSNQPNIVVNISGLDILAGTQPLRDRGTNLPTQRAHPKLPPRISLWAFVQRYSLLNEIFQKLNTIDISGPHCLRFITDQVLFQTGVLGVGQIADVRDAQERWENDEVNFEHP